MGISVGDVLLHLGVDSSELDKGMKEAVQRVQSYMKVVGAAVTAAGAGGLAMVQSYAKLNAALGQTALTLGIDSKQMRDLALSITDVGLPLKEVASTFDLLARAGMRNTEEITKTTRAFDQLSHATGLSADTVTSELIPSFKVFGIDLADAGNQVDKFTWLTKNTTVDLGDFASVMQWVARYGADLGVTLDDMVAIMAVLESRGITGTAATRSFRTAVTEAAGTGKGLNEVLKISQEQIAGYKSKLEGATGITEKYAAISETQYTLMDKLKQTWSELTLRLGGFLEPLQPILAGMTALGPIMIFFSTSMGAAAARTVAHTVALIAHAVAVGASKVAIMAATAAQWAWNVAMNANPIGVVILAVAALAAGIYALWRNWDSIVSFITGREKDQTRIIQEEARKQLEAKKKALDEMEAGAKSSYDKQVADIRAFYGVMEDQAQDSTQSQMDLARKASEARGVEIDKEITALQKAHDKAIELYNDEYDAKMKLIDAATTAAIKPIQDEIDALNKRMEGEDAAREEQESDAEELRLRNAVANAKTTKERKAAEAALNQFLYDKWSERQRKEEENQIADLEKRKAEIIDQAQAKKDALSAELDAERDQARDLLDIQVERLQNEKDNLDTALQEEFTRIDTERQAQEQLQADILTAVKNRILQERLALAVAEAVETGVQQGQQIPPSPPESKDIWWPNIRKLLGFETGGLSPNLEGHALGGLITEPTLLSRLSDLRPYGTMAERGPEYIMPAAGSPSQASIDRMIAAAIERGMARIGIRVQVGGQDVAAVVSREQFRLQQARA